MLSTILLLCLTKTGSGHLEEGRKEEEGRKPEPDYVPATDMGHNLEFYITEMPAEKLAKIKVNLESCRHLNYIPGHEVAPLQD